MLRITTLLLVLLCFLQIKASHTMGGDFTYKLLSTSGNSATYQLTLKVYRDCSNTSNSKLDNQINIKIFYAHNDQLYQTVSVNLLTATNVLPNCIDSTVACIQEGVYRRNVTLTTPTNTAFYGFNLVWARCCRNTGLTNIPDNQGQLWAAFIPSHTYKNNSVQYLNIPVPFLCRSRENTFNLNAFDPDGDSLVFRLARPYRAASTFCPSPNEAVFPCNQGDLVPPYKLINYRNGYSETLPFGAGSSVSINSVTGEIKALVNQNGNYVLAIEVEEFRKTKTGYVSMGTTRRDIQYIVRTCPANEAPLIDSAYSAGFNKQVNALEQLCFNIRAYDIENDSVYTSRVGAIFDNSQGLPAPYATLPERVRKGADTIQFCWQPSCEHISESPYIFTVFASDDKCNQRQRTYSVKVIPIPALEAPVFGCTEIVNDSVVKLTFKAPTDSTGLAFYRVYRAVTGSTGFVLVDTVYSTGAMLNYNDGGVTQAKTKGYQYYITAVNRCGKDGETSDTVATLLVDFNKITPGKGDLVWNAPTATNPQYQVKRRNSSVFTDVDSTPTLSYFLNECIVNTDYRIEVKTQYGCNIISNPVNVWLTPSDSVPPAAPEIKYATINTTGAIELAWHKSDSPYVKYYEIWQSNNGSPFTLQNTLEYDSLHTKTGLSTQNTIYSYYVIAKDSCPSANQSAPSDTISIVVPSLSTYACVPLVRLSWNTPVQFGTPTQKFEVERSTNGGGFISISTLSATATNYVDSAVINTNSYCYRLKATGTNTGFSAYSDTLCIQPTTYPLPTTVPINFTTVTATGAASGKTQTQWQRIPLVDTFARSYLLYHATDSAGAYSQIADITTLNDTLFEHTAINTETSSHFYHVRVRNLCNYVSVDSSERHGTMVASATGGNLTAALNWTAYKGWPVSNYRIHRGKTAGTQTPLLTLAGTALSYTDTGLSCGNNYYYKIEAIGAMPSQSSFSNIDSASVYDVIPPPANTMVRATVLTTGITDGQVTLQWNASTEKNRKGYNVYRSEAGGAYTLAGTINNTLSGTISYIDNNLNTKTQTNSYYVSVIDSCGNESVYSDTHTVTDITATPGFSEVVIQWTPYVGFGNYEYEVQRREPGVDWATLATLPKDSSQYIDRGTQCQTPYNYRIKTNNTDVVGLFSLSDTTLTKAFDTLAPAPPYLIRATRDNATTVLVQWASSPEPDVKEYVLQRARRYTAAWKTIYTTASDTFYYDTLTDIERQSYCYRLYAIDQCNNVGKTGNIGCLLMLHGDSKRFINELSWEGYQNWPMGIMEYRVYRSENGQFFAPIGDVNGNIYQYEDSLLTDTANLFCYYIEAQENIGGFATTSISNTICVTQKAAYHIPNSFTPSFSEGLNDGFGPVGQFISKVKLEIYDRWGRLVYTNPSGTSQWFGRSSGGDILPEGVYMYHILIYSYDGTKTAERGTVTLLR